MEDMDMIFTIFLSMSPTHISKCSNSLHPPSAIWAADKEKEVLIFSANEGNNYVPMIHYRDLIKIVVSLCVSEVLPCFFIPATDNSTSTTTNLAADIATATKRNLRITTREEALDLVLHTGESLMAKSICSHRVWNQDIRFSGSANQLVNVTLEYRDGFSLMGAEIWAEYVTKCAQEPASLFVVGPPSSLKSTLAKALATK
jgi:hypothetical protein